MTDACGCPRKRARRALRMISPKNERDYLSGAPLSEFRQSGASRRRVAKRQGSLRRRARRRAGRAGRLPGFRRCDPPARCCKRSARSTATCSTCTSEITGENAYQCPDADLSRAALHDGRAVGRLPIDVERSRDCSWPGRPTSPTTAPTGSAPARSCKVWPTAISFFRLHVPNYMATTRWRRSTLLIPRLRPPRMTSANASQSSSTSTASEPSIHSTRNSAR